MGRDIPDKGEMESTLENGQPHQIIYFRVNNPASDGTLLLLCNGGPTPPACLLYRI